MAGYVDKILKAARSPAICRSRAAEPDSSWS
jgi:hypothetical protein